MNLTPKEMARIIAETQGRLMADCAAAILSTDYQPIECLHGRIGTFTEARRRYDEAREIMRSEA